MHGRASHRGNLTLAVVVCTLLMRRSIASRAASASAAERGAVVLPHLSTKAPYAQRVPIPDAPSIHDLPDPPGYEPVHMHLLARHGTRWPTRKRARQMTSLEPVLQGATSPDHAWAAGWASPFKRLPYVHGDLHPVGEGEMAGLAQRLRARFPALLRPRYFWRRYPLLSSSVARASQSASAFALGFFGAPAAGQGGQGEGDGPLCAAAWRPQPVAIHMASRRGDPLLRFFDCCPAYQQHEDATERWLAPWAAAHLDRIAPKLSSRLGLAPDRGLDAGQVDALWQLCTYQAGAEGNTSGACSLFDEGDARLMEWLEDVSLWEVQGYGDELNYHIAAPLAADIVRSLTDAASSPGRAPLQHARLLFAHCETLTPLAALLGLFRPTPGEAGACYPSPLPWQRGAGAGRDGGAAAAADGAVLPPMREVGEDLAAAEAADDLPLIVAERQARQRAAEAAGGSQEGSSGSAAARKAGGGPAAALRSWRGKDLGVTTEPPPGWEPGVGPHPGRTWRGGRVAPLGGNLAIVLYRRRDNGSAPHEEGGSLLGAADADEAPGGEEDEEAASVHSWGAAGGAAAEEEQRRRRRLRGRHHLVRLVWNEQVVPLPAAGCGGGGHPAGGSAAPDARQRRSTQQLDLELGAVLDWLTPLAADAAALRDMCRAEAPGADEGGGGGRGEAAGEAGAAARDPSGAWQLESPDGLPLQLPDDRWWLEDSQAAGGSGGGLGGGAQTAGAAEAA